MRLTSVLLIGFLFTISSEASEILEWHSPAGVPKALYEAINVDADVSTHPISADIILSVKELEGVKCTHTLINPTPMNLVGGTEFYECSVDMGMTDEQVNQFYSALQAKSLVKTNYPLQSDLKIIPGSGLILMESAEDQYKMFYAKPCVAVQSEAKAKACMDYWAANIIQSYESPNEVITTGDEQIRENLVSLIEAELSGLANKYIKDELWKVPAVKNAEYVSVVNQAIYVAPQLLYFVVPRTSGDVASQPVLVEYLNLEDPADDNNMNVEALTLGLDFSEDVIEYIKDAIGEYDEE